MYRRYYQLYFAGEWCVFGELEFADRTGAVQGIGFGKHIFLLAGMVCTVCSMRMQRFGHMYQYHHCHEQQCDQLPGMYMPCAIHVNKDRGICIECNWVVILFYRNGYHVPWHNSISFSGAGYRLTVDEHEPLKYARLY